MVPKIAAKTPTKQISAPKMSKTTFIVATIALVGVFAAIFGTISTAQHRVLQEEN